MKGEKMLDKMKAKCTAVSIDFSGGKQYITSNTLTALAH
jgi:hypothetical protein